MLVRMQEAAEQNLEVPTAHFQNIIVFNRKRVPFSSGRFYSLLHQYVFKGLCSITESLRLQRERRSCVFLRCAHVCSATNNHCMKLLLEDLMKSSWKYILATSPKR